MNKLYWSLSLLWASMSYAQQNTLLERSFWKNDTSIEQVKSEISKGNSPSEKDRAAFDPATIAIMKNAPLSTLIYMIEQEGNGIEKTTHDGRTYLHWAAFSGNSALMEYLLQKGASLSVKDTKGNTPIAYAALSGQNNIAVYDAFFKHGISPEATYKDGASLLLLCIANDQPELPLTNFFISKGMSLKAVDNYGRNAFDYACQKGNTALLEALSALKIKPTKQALLMAAQGVGRHTNKVEIYQYLVEKHGLKTKTTDHHGATPLHYVARKGDTDGVNYLLSQKARVCIADKKGNSPLLQACHTKNMDIIPLLWGKKNLNMPNAEGQTPLLAACRYGTADAVRILLEKGATPSYDAKGNGIITALIESYTPEIPARKQPENIAEIAQKAKLLTAKGIQLSRSEADANNAYHYAATKHSTALIELVGSWGASINQKNTNGETPLIKAALVAQNDAVLKALIAQGADKNATTEYGETAFELAQENEMLQKNNVSIEFLK